MDLGSGVIDTEVVLEVLENLGLQENGNMKEKPETHLHFLGNTEESVQETEVSQRGRGKLGFGSQTPKKQERRKVSVKSHNSRWSCEIRTERHSVFARKASLEYWGQASPQ